MFAILTGIGILEWNDVPQKVSIISCFSDFIVNGKMKKEISCDLFRSLNDKISIG